MRAWSGQLSPALNTISPLSCSSRSNARWNSIMFLTSCGAQLSTSLPSSRPTCIISMYFIAAPSEVVAGLPRVHSVGQVRHHAGVLRADRLQRHSGGVHALEQADPGAEQHG